MVNCKVCYKKITTPLLQVPEMLNGTREIFDYYECEGCGCVQLLNPPESMDEYYSNDNYGSFEQTTSSYIARVARKIRNSYAIRKKNKLVGSYLFSKHPIPVDFTIIGSYAQSESRILDVGCGAGNYLRDLCEIGFDNVAGIDPFIEKDEFHELGFKISKLFIEDVTEKYDVVLSHHSLEHVPNPLNTLKGIANCLEERGVLILTIPVAENLFREYRESCYLLQAPQHFYLFSINSIKLLAEKSGLKIDRIIREADTNLDWLKISYLWSQNKTVEDLDCSLDESIPPKILQEFEMTIQDYKKNELGDNVIFILSLANAIDKSVDRQHLSPGGS